MLKGESLKNYTSILNTSFLEINLPFPEISAFGFTRSSVEVLNYNLDQLENYEEDRNFPAANKTSYLSPHLRFGNCQCA